MYNNIIMLFTPQSYGSLTIPVEHSCQYLHICREASGFQGDIFATLPWVYCRRKNKVANEIDTEGLLVYSEIVATVLL